jgi:hypothetical protein
VATEVMPVPANAKVVDLAENLFTQNISTATSISYSSDRQVVGFQLNGSSGGMMLDALPALAGAAPATCSPEVTVWAPRGEADTARPTISATISSACGVDIDQSSIEMTLDASPVGPLSISGSGSEVTASYQVTEPPLLELEDHTATVSAQDVNGQVVEKTWTFFVPRIY